MTNLAQRFPGNPIITPQMVQPSVPGAVVECVLNPGAFQRNGKTYLLLRVAERMPQRNGYLSTLVADESAPGGTRLVEFRRDDPLLDSTDPRVFSYDGQAYLTTLSHLRLAESKDGRTFTFHPRPTLTGEGMLEAFGIEDCRVSLVDGVYHLTYTAVSSCGVAGALRTTRDWKDFQSCGVILPPHNKDVAIFEERIDGLYYLLHRPSGIGLGGNDIWLASSPDLRHWGNHRCIARTRKGCWDEERIGAGAAPIRTSQGWLEIYHGADKTGRYCLGALLLDAHDPSHVIARSRHPIMEPEADYEQNGFFANCVFTNGHVVDGDTLTVYYGASDSVICGAEFSLEAILRSLH